MKKTIWITLVLLLMCVLVLSACDSGDIPPSNDVTNQTGSNNGGGNNEGDDTSPSCQHTSSDWITDKAATCKEAGSKHKECTACEEVLETASIDKLTTHTPGEAVTENYVDSNCETEGSYNLVVYCSVCNEKLSTEAKTVEKKPHTPSDWITDKEATCKEAGSKHRECIACEEVLETASIDKLTTHTPVTDPRVEPTFTTTGLTEGSHCNVCGVVLVAQDTIPMIPSKTTLTSNALSLDGRNLYGSFSYATEIFNFANDITVTNNSPWVVSTDSYGMQAVATKIVPLNEGSNTFYIHVTNHDQTVSTYTVNIYRNHLYTVSFNANGGTSVSTQYVEEGYLAEEPITSRIGYTFVAWDYNFNTPITSNITINANWNADGDTPYKVEYYLQNLDKTGYIPMTSEEENLTGATDTTAYAEQKTFEHFTLNSYMSALSGNINGNGSLVLKVYYTRNTYNVSVSRNNTKAGTVSSGGSYTYDKEITLTATTNLGYTFLGWFEGEEKVCDTLSYTFNVDHTATYTAKWETNVYNITYELNGGVNNESNVATYTIEMPTITLYSPERTGYEFGGWFIDSEFTTQATKITLGSYGEKIFYAKWSPIVYKVTYDLNYQSVTTESAYVITNDSTYPWNVSNGVLISSNKANSSSATYKIVANTEIVVNFKYKVSSESGYDYFTIVKNGTQVDKISGSTSYVAYSTTLYPGEYITFTYSKDTSQYSGSDCAYIADLVCTPNRYTTDVEYNIETPTFNLMTPERAGYTFNGWFTEGTFENQVSNISLGSHGDKTFYAKWTANTNTPYRVEYYLENVDKNGYAEPIVVILTGTTDTSVSADQKTFEHFTFDEAKSIVTGNINGDGSLVLTIYYTRNVYTLSNSNTNYGSITNAGSYVYGSSESFKTVATVPKLGYEFLGWYSEGELLSIEPEISFDISKNIIAMFDIAVEMKNFKFTSTATTCSITGIKNTSVTEIVVPDYVTSISGGAFAGCSSLESITLPFIGGSVKTSSDNNQYPLGYIFGTTSYSGSVKTRQYYPYSTTYITNSTYYIPSSLKSVTITGSSVLYGAFSYCTNLNCVTIGSNVTSIASAAFEGCINLTSVNIIDISAWCNVSFGGENANPFYYASNLYINGVPITELVIPDNVTTIGSYAFSYCTSLNSITFPRSITSIGDFAFSSCTSLTNITIPENIASIGDCAFNNCKNLTNISVANGNKSYMSIDGNLYTYDGKSLILYAIGKTATEFIVSSGVTNIEAYAFAYCTALKSIVIPDSVESIGECAFSECTSLESITLPFVGANRDASYNKVQGRFTYIFGFENHYRATECDCRNHDAYIDANYYIQKIPSSLKNVIITGGTIKIYAFQGCKMIENVTIGGSVATVECYAFDDCTSLKSITIGASVNEIQRNAFDGCTALEYAVFEITTGWCYYEWYKYYDISSSALADKTTARYYFNYGEKLIRR